jgi:ABC-type transport system involved in multi-copper enzyme maturation permease subunit
MNQILYRLTLNNLFKSKQFWFALGVSLLPLLISVAAAIGGRKEAFTPMLPSMLFGLLAFTLLLAALILAGGLMSDEVEDRTISYLLTCPVSRKDLFLSRALAVSVLLSGLAIVQGLGAYFGELLNYFITDQGVEYDRFANNSSARMMGLGFLFAIICPPIIAVTYGLFAGLASLVVGKWHLIPVVCLGVLDLYTSMLIAFPLGPISATSTIFNAALDEGIKAGFWPISFLVIPAYLVLWAWLGVVITKRKDFHVTSAVT